MHTESQIRRAIKPLLELYGELNTSQIKEILEEVLDFDNEDLILSDTRNGEIKILQRIGNIVSHQLENVKTYPEGFIIDKSYKPAKWYVATGLSTKIDKITTEAITKRKKYATKHILQRPYKKINWEMVNERRSCIGLAGEQFVFQLECDKVRNFDKAALDRVIHLSVKQGDGFGYDILSLNEFGETIYIEVKTTSSNENTPFYMSRNEKFFFENNMDNNAYLYRVYDFDLDAKHGKIKIISAKDLIENYDFDPISFMVTLKTQ